jgi:hypothetical protein
VRNGCDRSLPARVVQPAGAVAADAAIHHAPVSQSKNEGVAPRRIAGAWPRPAATMSLSYRE